MYLLKYLIKEKKESKAHRKSKGKKQNKTVEI